MDAANRRIAKNTVYMYIRLCTVMVIGLYTSRLVLEILGVSDFGLFSVVGGILGLFTFISSSLSNATSRFLNVEMGKKDGDINRCFNINVLLHGLLALLILLLAETVGLWYVLHHLNVAEGKLDDAVFVYQMSVVTACIGITNSPFQSLFNAHEQFRFMAFLDMTNSFIRLGCILLLTLYQGENALRLYGLIFCLTTVNTFAVYHIAAYRRWPQTVKPRLVIDRKTYKEVLVFGNWNLLATLSYMARSSGSDLLLNTFFGTSVNGAFAIGKSVNSYVSTFSCNFDNAASPQIIQAYAAGDRQRVAYLVNKTGRYNLLLFNLMFFPLFVELEYILHLWLGHVPEGALTFVQLYLLVAGVSLSCGGLSPLLRAFGDIKWFQLELSFFFLICIPIGYYVFAAGFPPYYILYLFLAADVMHRLVQLIMLRLMVGFSSRRYVQEAYLRPACIAVVMSIGLYLYMQHPMTSPPYKWCAIIATGILTLLLTLFVGMTRQERQSLLKR